MTSCFDDPLEWARGLWEAGGLADSDLVIAMTSVLRAQQIIDQRLSDVLKPFGLNILGYNSLMMLSLSKNGRPTGRVTWGLIVHPATVTTVIDRLERHDLVQRHPDPHDRRATIVTITEQGREVAKEATDALAEIRFGLDGLSLAEAQNLTAALVGLREAAGDSRPAGKS